MTLLTPSSPAAIQSTEDAEGVEECGDCLKDPPNETTNQIYYHTTSSPLEQLGNQTTSSCWQHSKLLTTGYWPPSGHTPVVDMFFRPTLRQQQVQQQQTPPLPQPPPPPPSMPSSSMWNYDDPCQYNPTQYQSDFYTDPSTYVQPNTGNQWESPSSAMRTEDVVVSGRFQLQLEVQARIRREETGATSTIPTPTSNVVGGGGGYLPNGPTYGIAYTRRPPQASLQNYVEPHCRQEDRQFVGN